MGWSRRALWLSLCCASAVAASCFGGPTSDWPKGADGDEDGTPPKGGPGPSLDAGSIGSAPRDAAVLSPTYDDCIDGGVSDAGGSADGGAPIGTFTSTPEAADAGTGHGSLPTCF